MNEGLTEVGNRMSWTMKFFSKLKVISLSGQDHKLQDVPKAAWQSFTSLVYLFPQFPE